MRVLYFFFVLISGVFSAQKILPFDTLNLKEVKDMQIDDYGNVYLYRNKDFSFTKYDSVGRQLGKLMFTVPYRVQNVQNPLSIPVFSENAQEMKFVDQNLNEIQKINLREKFSFIRFAYAEDLQQIWLLDESTKRLIQYNFRNDTTINAYPFNLNIEDLIDLLIYEGKVYMISKDFFSVYNLKFEKLFEAPIENARRLRRENERIAVICASKIFLYTTEDGFQKIFEDPETQIVDKNSLAFFEIKGNKLYLYTKGDLNENRFPKSFETGLKPKEEERPASIIEEILETDKVLREEEKEPASQQQKD
ncbi:hypothetical protein [Chryseobacterium sp. Leaf180]|uniref:hypothetical protein n=1 Tax=Chryseobacterium sp. Leaf180 TaxID=1736289 RepID=UPI00161655C4|nr:hypothetical protein [Chryseobacterium sp. Leaf180]